jgi:hypothetical protein
MFFLGSTTTSVAITSTAGSTGTTAVLSSSSTTTGNRAGKIGSEQEYWFKPSSWFQKCCSYTFFQMQYQTYEVIPYMYQNVSQVAFLISCHTCMFLLL